MYIKKDALGRDKRKIERVDSVVDYDFGEGSPGEEIGNEEFSIRWDGSFIAEQTGDYRFIVRSENGFRLYLNRSDKALVDGWVASGGDVVDKEGTIHLIGGRAYPLRLEYFKYKGKTASIELMFQPPDGVEQILPKS